MEAMTPIPAPSMDARPAAEADGAAEAFAREAQRQRQDAADPERDGEDEAGERERDRSRLPAGALWQPPLPPHWNAARLSAGGRHAAEAALSAPGKRGRTPLGEGEGPDAGARGKTAARPQGAQAAAAALAAQHAASLAPTADAPVKVVAQTLGAQSKAEPALRKAEHASAKGEASLPAAAPQTAAAAPTPPGRTVSKAEAAAPVPTPAAAREGGETRKTESAPAAAALTPPPAQPSATPPPREAAPQARPRQDPALSQTTPSAPSAPEPAQPGLTYRFQRWGGEHAVNVQSQPGGVLSLQPSDSLVQQRLGEQWQSGNPQQWQMARDDGREQGRQQPQRDEEEDA